MSSHDKPMPGVIFDLDGTLADTLDDITASLNHALTRIGAATHDRSVVARMVGDGVRELVARAIGSSEPKAIERVLPYFAAHYREHALDATRLYPGIDHQLDQLTASGWRLAVLSNKPHEFTLQCCRALLDRWRFDVIRGVDADTPKKPDPTAALQIAASMHLPPGNIYFVGDSPGDLITGRSAGMVTVAAAWGFRPEAQMRSENPDVWASSPDVLMSTLTEHRRLAMRT